MVFHVTALALRRALQERGLALPSAWCGLDFFQTSS